MFTKYAGSNAMSSLAKDYSVFPNSDGQGGLWGNMRMQIRDPAVQEWLCTINSACGGFVADGWYGWRRTHPVRQPPSRLLTLFVGRAGRCRYKAANPAHVPYPGSTLYVKKQSVFAATPAVAAAYQ